MAGEVLILDDEVIVAMDLADILEDNDFVARGPYHSSEDALSGISERLPTAALLDVNLGDGRTSGKVAERLRAENVPFAFITGYAQLSDQLDAQWRDAPQLGKPFSEKDVVSILSQLLRN